MTLDPRLPALRALILKDQIELVQGAQEMARAIHERHQGAVRGLVFYGSAMRQGEFADKMYDFYVIVDRYKSVYGSGLKRFGSWLLPPGVHFLQITYPDGRRLRSKYSIVSEKAFHRRSRGGAFESMLWARFAQPSVVVSEDPQVYADLIDTLALSCVHFSNQIRPLMSGMTDPLSPWVRGLSESYRTELRPERPDARAREIVARFEARYRKLSEILFAGELQTPPRPGRITSALCQARWIMRRIVGKPMGALRVLKAAATFDAGLDYILEKVESHSGVRLEVTEAERRRPLLHAPSLAWRLYRAGAFR
ncbi:conserved hypothetical protein [Hyphomonas neptunium ATCC 15444]|uniref:Phosphatidate cytidylyltransferase n=2 Tax=Hyphomonas TaxID=85 RepID=Q0C1U4_HYPNA|nr:MULTISPECIES: hypothetical protein [Hyphomonas]ABI78724.1 conserved hypothetical protein [Hyphomonas neptunium ATCC 15444]KCZ92616.1 hypothetical protein HHI_11571 [Hyphomonas hirschiana VP5]